MLGLFQKAFRYIFKYIKNLPRFYRTKAEFIRLNANVGTEYQFQIGRDLRYLTDIGEDAGNASEYFFQDLWAAKKISKLDSSETHYDIGSRIDGFISSLLSFRGNIVLIDIRPMDRFLDEGLRFIQEDATLLEGIADNSVASLSALCSLEHFGLGRFGDDIDPMSCFHAFASIQRVMKPGGHVFISVPIGRQCVAFNAHRIYDPRTITSQFRQCELVEFTVITNDAKTPYHYNANPADYADQNLGFVGLFEFKKNN